MFWVECNHLGGKRGEASHGFPFLVRESPERAAHQLRPNKNTTTPSVSSNEKPLLTLDNVIWRAEFGGAGDMHSRYWCSFSDIYTRPARLEHRNRDG